MAGFRIAVVTLFLGVPGMAVAGLEICNDTDVSQTVAIGYKGETGWVSEGWWNIDSGSCSEPVTGDLKLRYYYYLSRADGRRFEDENYHFCTTDEAFTIEGDEDCTGRGYDTGLFRRIDTGKTAKHFTISLSSYSRDSASEEPEGEPFADSVTFQECLSGQDGTAAYCAFHSGGTKFFVYDDGRTADWMFTFMSDLLPGTPLDVTGELTGIFDRTAEVVLSNALPRAWSDADGLLDRLQGEWYATDDPNSRFTVLGAERLNTYDGAPISTEYLSVQEQCDGASGNGPYLYAREEETGQSLCYAIDYVDNLQLNLIFLPRGNLLEYRKLD